MKKRNLFALVLCLVLAMCLIAGCGGAGGGNGEGHGDTSYDSAKDIIVVTRESGSGTRGAFIELFKVEVRDGSNKKDMTTPEAITTNKTDVMLTTIAGNEYAIGYVSVGSLNNSVKALKVDGAAAGAENIKSGAYKISRPFIVGTKGTVSGLSEDFIAFVMSKEGQAVVSANNYVEVAGSAAAYSGDKPSGKLVVAGSSSVTPVMEKLKEAYEEINTDAKIEIQMTDSSAGIRALLDGTCDLAMSSRELTSEEAAQIDATVIAMDGIAVIVSKDNPTTDVTSEQVRQVFTGEVTTWDKIQ